MEENEGTTANTETNDTPGVETRTAPTATTGAASATPVVGLTPAPAPPIPDGYVSAEIVESERTARTTAETARTEAEARAVAAESRARATEIRMAAQGLHFNDPADAERFIGSDVENVAEALAEVLKAKPYLAKAAEVPAPLVTPTSPTNPARSAALTLDAIKSMSKEQLAANWPAVKEALRVGQ